MEGVFPCPSYCELVTLIVVCFFIYMHFLAKKKKLQIFYEKMSLGQEGFFFLEQLEFPISDLCVRVIFLIFLFFLGKCLDLRDDLFLMPP